MSAVPGARAPRVVTVKRLADYLKRKVESDEHLRNIAVRGEVSGLRRQPSGNVNFALKDADALINCFAFASVFARGSHELKDGLALVATGSVTSYAQRSSYQLVVRAVEFEGVGDLHALFEERKRTLTAEGVFAAQRKRPLPRYPFRIALVSSRTANGAQDFVTLLNDRAPHVGIVWCETVVQGPNAPGDIVRALARASRADVDCIVLTRGGGSFEDLFCFSDERVVRAVAAAKHPIVSAIGHTADQQLCDFAADVHVETPSAAAKALGFARADLAAMLDDRVARARAAAALRVERFYARLSKSLVRSKLADARLFLAPLAQRSGDLDASLASAVAASVRLREGRVRELERRLGAFDPRTRLAERARRLQRVVHALDVAGPAARERAVVRLRAASGRLEPATRAVAARCGQTLTLARAHLDGNDPEAILQRGYAIVSHRGTIVRDPATLAPGEAIEARVARGTIFARVESEGGHGN
ncbi:MAG: exodeoxyribonuclease VII large subunit [Vulcanimicrobiaceae bacterium]